MKKDNDTAREKKRREIERAEWEGSLYHDGENLFVPGDNIHACIVGGARKAKLGKQVESGMLPVDDVPIKTALKPGESLDKIYDRKEFSLRKPVRIPPRTGARLMKVRPMIPSGWELNFEVEFDQNQLSKDNLVEAMREAGRKIGLGDWRPRFGRFIVEET